MKPPISDNGGRLLTDNIVRVLLSIFNFVKIVLIVVGVFIIGILVMLAIVCVMYFILWVVLAFTIYVVCFILQIERTERTDMVRFIFQYDQPILDFPDSYGIVYQTF